MEYKEYTGKTLSDAITEACQKLTVTSDRLDYEVVEEGSAGFLGIGQKNAVIRARIKEMVFETPAPKVETSAPKAQEAPAKEESAAEAPAAEPARQEPAPEKTESPRRKIASASSEAAQKTAEEFLQNVLKAMDIEAVVKTSFNEEDQTMEIELVGDDMGLLIGKRGATLDSLQYLVSLVVNKESEEYIRVKVDTENYRARRKETLENLAKNVASKVKKSGRPYELEPMNPYERRIIHSALQDNRYVETVSEGEEPNRHVIVRLKEGVRPTGEYGNRRGGRRF
ncbi:MAG: protein jag [Lachnospiraceae bacterium]|nr:protein jag [Lachnospiraceae bacterium]